MPQRDAEAVGDAEWDADAKNMAIAIVTLFAAHFKQERVLGFIFRVFIHKAFERSSRDERRVLFFGRDDVDIVPNGG